MYKKLSILTCTLASRSHLFKKLETRLKNQTKHLAEVELIAHRDNGEIPIGQKRNQLLESAKGDYVVFVDDDDIVSNDYVAKILKAINLKRPDCCGIEGMIMNTKPQPKKFIHSIRFKEWYEEEGVYYRCPNHLNPIKRELALEVKFAPINNGEDHLFSKEIFPLLKTEVFISGVLYFYNPSR